MRDESENMNDLTQAFLPGALMGMLHREGREIMKIVEVGTGNEAPTGFEVRFASGLKLAVRVSVLER